MIRMSRYALPSALKQIREAGRVCNVLLNFMHSLFCRRERDRPRVPPQPLARPKAPHRRLTTRHSTQEHAMKVPLLLTLAGLLLCDPVLVLWPCQAPPCVTSADIGSLQTVARTSFLVWDAFRSVVAEQARSYVHAWVCVGRVVLLVQYSCCYCSPFAAFVRDCRSTPCESGLK